MLRRAAIAHEPPPQRWPGLLIALGAHAALLGALLAWEPSRNTLVAAAPIMASLITAPAPQPRPDVPPRPLPARPRVHPPAPPLATAAAAATALTAPADAPAARVAPAQPDAPRVAPPLTAANAPAATVAPAPATAPLPVTAPRFDAAYLDNPAPAYPVLARRMGEQGRVLLRVLVSAAGAAEQVELRTSSGSARLDNAALETVRRWRFVPARQGDAPVAAWVVVPISFSLQG